MFKRRVQDCKSRNFVLTIRPESRIEEAKEWQARVPEESESTWAKCATEGWLYSNLQSNWPCIHNKKERNRREQGGRHEVECQGEICGSGRVLRVQPRCARAAPRTLESPDVSKAKTIELFAIVGDYTYTCARSWQVYLPSESIKQMRRWWNKRVAGHCEVWGKKNSPLSESNKGPSDDN